MDRIGLALMIVLAAAPGILVALVPLIHKWIMQ